MTLAPLTDFSLTLQQQQKNSWQKFAELHESVAAVLTPAQLADFQRAITLSDFILRSAQQAPAQVVALFASDAIYQQEMPDYAGKLAQLLPRCDSEEQLHKALRLFRLTAMVQIAVADLVLNMPLAESLTRLSNLADALILAALGWLTPWCQQKWGVPCNSQGQAQPLLVYGMGKLGGQELNFSSDIDLIFAFPESGETSGVRRQIDNQQFFTRLGQKLITALHQQTVDGFVYRVDMRLRPFGESGPLVMSFNALEDYYQEQGRDWERYAMLKARLIGDGPYHHQLSDMLRPFVYRRYIDFSVIDSLRRMKMMISQEVRRKQLRNNIKLGAGGIREIEFIVQVFQLMRGGRDKLLQQRNLLTVLPLLVSQQVISEKSRQVLEQAYCFLRRVENIIQALADQQTQTLPEPSIDQQRLLYALKIASWPEFLECLQAHMSAVNQQFIGLIGEDSAHIDADDEHWATLWHSQWSEAESISWITQHAPDWQSEVVWSQLANFRHEVDKSRIGNRGRQVLDKLMPIVLWHIERGQFKASSLERVLPVIQKIITRTAYLELLYENDGALKHLIKLCDASNWVADYIARFPILLDELIDPQLLNNTPSLSSYAHELREIMLRIPEDDLEAQMEALRQFKQAQQLRIAVADIVGILPIMKVSDHLTVLAQAVISEVVNLAWLQMIARYGAPESTLGQNHKGFAVIGYGKLGGFELGYGSDLDLVFLHNSSSEEMTSGARQVLATQFYAKLAQRIMHIFSARMNGGILYELDMRLRPSGNSGLLVVHIDTFCQYQLTEAWSWEHQALVRARTVYGHDALTQRFADLRHQVLALPRNALQLKNDVIAMRDKMRVHLDKSVDDYFDLKQAVGGLVDIEFLAQYLVLMHSNAYPDIGAFSDNVRIFEQLCHYHLLSEDQRQLLSQCYCDLRNLGHQATLQNEQQPQLSTELLALTAEVATIYQQFLGE